MGSTQANSKTHNWLSCRPNNREVESTHLGCPETWLGFSLQIVSTHSEKIKDFSSHFTKKQLLSKQLHESMDYGDSLTYLQGVFRSETEALLRWDFFLSLIDPYVLPRLLVCVCALRVYVNKYVASNTECIQMYTNVYMYVLNTHVCVYECRKLPVCQGLSAGWTIDTFLLKYVT